MSAIVDDVVLWACVDCLQYAAGIPEKDRGEPYPPAVLEAVERMRRDNYPACVELIPGSGDHHDGCAQGQDYDADCDCEYDNGGFSWSPCEMCLSSLGGDRHAITLLLTVPN
jgi:hypothetical protein